MGMGMVGLLPDHTIIPLLAVQEDPHALDSAAHRSRLSTAAAVAPIQFWGQQQTHDAAASASHHHHHQLLPNFAAAVANSGIGIGSSSGSTTCQDCGNQAKKDCSHRRCRTCCKSRRFECSTHVKSTWVPAARRRERQLQTASTAAGSSASTSTTKKPRLISSQTTTTASHTSTSNTTPPRSFDSGSSHQDASFRESLPGQVRVPAVFKCVRVTAIDDGDDEYAYQAVVKIGGHVFKGFLYDQGVEGKGEGMMPNISDLHLGGGTARSHARPGGASSSSPVLDPSDIYAASGPPGLLGSGSSFGNQIN